MCREPKVDCHSRSVLGLLRIGSEVPVVGTREISPRLDSLKSSVGKMIHDEIRSKDTIMSVLRIVFVLLAWVGVSPVELSLQANRILVVKFEIIYDPLKVWCANKEFSPRCKNAIALVKQFVNLVVPDMLNAILGDNHLERFLPKR